MVTLVRLLYFKPGQVPVPDMIVPCRRQSLRRWQGLPAETASAMMHEIHSILQTLPGNLLTGYHRGSYMKNLTGMSWDHPRGHDSIVAASEAFMKANPGVSISWRTRSLQDFADYPVSKLAELFDLILIDHPFIGEAAATGCLLPADQYLDAAFLADQAANSVGQSHVSYQYAGRQWALATDAACQVASYRPDLMAEAGAEPPTSWAALLRFAAARKRKRRGQVAIPLIPVDTLMCFCTICASHGEDPFVDPERVVSREMGRFAAGMLLQLRELIHPESSTFNPIRVYDRMSTTDEIAYVPLAFGYSNYARAGFRPHLLKFANIPRSANGAARGAILGGVGLAVSATTKEAATAFKFARHVASADVQRGVFFTGGGQPGHRAAWLDPAVNAASSNFFLDTLETIDHSFLRPRYHGYLHVQDEGFLRSHEFLFGHGDVERFLDELDALYRGSKLDQ
jgi:multiple sugar transport system substrate-binding protein